MKWKGTNNLKLQIKSGSNIFGSILANFGSQSNPASVNTLNNDLIKIIDWAMKWKMSFNPDPSKNTQEVKFFRKRRNSNHDSIYFNHNSVQQVHFRKELGMYLDTILNFQEHLNNIMTKVNKTIQQPFPRYHL